MVWESIKEHTGLGIYKGYSMVWESIGYTMVWESIKGTLWFGNL